MNDRLGDASAVDGWLGDAGLRVDYWLIGKIVRMIIWGWDMQLVMELVGLNHLAVRRLNLLFFYFFKCL